MAEDEFGAFQETVMKYRAERKFAILELQRKERVQIVLDFSFLKDYMEKGGMMVQNELGLTRAFSGFYSG